MNWSRRFEDQITIGSGHPIVTLEDAAKYILSLPARDAKADHWKVAAETLMLVAEFRGPIMMAHIAMLRAINHGRPAPTAERRKRAKSYRILR